MSALILEHLNSILEHHFKVAVSFKTTSSAFRLKFQNFQVQFWVQGYPWKHSSEVGNITRKEIIWKYDFKLETQTNFDQNNRNEHTLTWKHDDLNGNNKLWNTIIKLETYIHLETSFLIWKHHD